MELLPLAVILLCRIAGSSQTFHQAKLRENHYVRTAITPSLAGLADGEKGEGMGIFWITLAAEKKYRMRYCVTGNETSMQINSMTFTKRQN